LEYTLELRNLAESDSPYVDLQETTETSYEWDTRTVPDGWYAIRVSASDSPDNVNGQQMSAKRVSAPVLVDNTPPRLVSVKAQAAAGSDDIEVSARAEDRLSAIGEVRYAVDGSTDWQPVLPDDKIYDSTSEAVSFTIPDLSPGPHVITLRAVDSQGNAHYVARTVQVSD
jgi:hypothetical protein